MPHIALNTGTPGIAGLFEYRPETARPLQQLAYVDGLAAVTPEDPEAYAKLAERIVTQGYLRP